MLPGHAVSGPKISLGTIGDNPMVKLEEGPFPQELEGVTERVPPVNAVEYCTLTEVVP